ncbi:MAG: APC family permease [Clostridia bacterium]|nr:APC family permease [Clostridia bacterium]
MDSLKKRYGLSTAICMVVGIVIGSGVFFKAQDVLDETGGDAALGVLAWIIGGAVMVTLAATFAVLATKYERVGGVVDYAETLCGKTYGYFVGWFLSLIYFPAMTSVLAWVSARYTVVALFGVSSVSERALFGPECIAIAALYLVLSYFINAVAPRLAGKIQVSATVIKLIPLFVIAIVGVAVGSFNGTLGESLSAPVARGGGSLFAAVSCTAFAYEGWIIATAINAEIKNAKRNLPIALTVGAAVIVLAYLLFYLGVLGLADTDTLLTEGTTAAFDTLGPFFSSVINMLVVVSCLGTLNGLMLATTRGIFALSVRGEGVSPSTFSEVDRHTNTPHNSASLGLLLTALWLFYFLGSQFFGWFGALRFDSSELPVLTIYPLYAPILISFMIKERGTHPALRFVLPSLSLVGCGIMVAASIFRHGSEVLAYLLVFAAIMLLGAAFLFLNRKRKKDIEISERV